MKFALRLITLATALTICSGMEESAPGQKSFQRNIRLDQRILNETDSSNFCRLFVEARLESNGKDTYVALCAVSPTKAIPLNVPESWIYEKMNAGLLVPGVSQLNMDGLFINSAGELESSFGEFEILYDPDLDNDRRLLISGNRKVLVVRVAATNGVTTASESDLANYVFGNSIGLSNSVSLATQYSACSKGALTFSPATGNGVTNGVTTVSIGLSTSAGKDSMTTAVGNALMAKFPGIDFNLYGSGPAASGAYMADHVLYCFPSGTMSNAVGQIYSWNAVFDNSMCTYSMSLMHEVGHNLGFPHDWSATQGEYMDTTGIMGISWQENQVPACPNGVRLWQTEWYSANHYVWYQGDSSTKTLQGIVGSSGSKPKLLRIPASQTTDSTTSTKMDYYVWFNLARSYNSGTKQAQNQVVIARAQDTTGMKKFVAYVNGTSFQVATLSAGGSYTIGGQGAGCPTITVGSIDTSSNEGTASVAITGCGNGQGTVPQGTYPVCNICMDGSYPINPNLQISMYAIPGTPTCDELYGMGTSGQIGQDPCYQLQLYIKSNSNSCCKAVSAPTAPAPTTPYVKKVRPPTSTNQYRSSSVSGRGTTNNRALRAKPILNDQ